MLIVYLLLLFLFECQTISVQENKSDLTTCVQNIIAHWIQNGSEITYVDLNYRDDDILRSIHSMKFNTVVCRKTDKRINYNNNAYIIAAGNFDIFKNQFKNLSKEKYWKPNVYFIIVFKENFPKPIKDLFDILIRYHVFNVIVINGKVESQIYTYDPFENNGCGKTYFQIKHFNTCFNENISKLFSTFDNRLKGCTFNFATSHRAPFSIKPTINKHNEKLIGTEQFVLKILGEIEGFKINYTLTYDPDVYPAVKDDMTATGVLRLIQDGVVDIVFGGILLLSDRAEAFSYFYEHQAYTDELVILVKRAGLVAPWKNVYLEFTYVVWFLLFVTLLIFFALFVTVFRVKDKCKVMLIMWGLLFQHGYRKGFNFKMEYFFIQWVLFAFFINTFYQSNLMGLTTHGSHDYQISDEEDIKNYQLEPCISNNMKGLLNATIGNDYDEEMNEDCDKTMSSMKTVSLNYKKYTLVMHSLFSYNKFKYIDNYGKPLLYTFKIPTNKIIYAVYFYKGFPKMNMLRYNALRIRESGLLEKHYRDLYYEEAKKYKFNKQGFKAQFILPWYILIIGVVFSGITLLLELLIHFLQGKRTFKPYLP